MKQCPNPNCIFYTRLEELPDAYLKCPGCGGALVDSNTLSGKLAPDPQARPFESRYPLPNVPDERSSLHLDQVQLDPDLYPSHSPHPSRPADEGDPYAVGDPYAYGQDTEEDPEGVAEQQPRWTTASKVIIALSASLLVLGCLILVLLLGNRFFPQGRTITSAQATETAVASLRPPINTPIIAPPTNTQPAAQFPTVPPQPTERVEVPTQAPPTPVIEQPTQIAVIPTQPPLPTQALPPPTAVAQEATPGPTAPPPRTDPSGGITNAQMSGQLQGGEPTGDVSAYNVSDPFNLAVQATFGAGAVTSITTRWYGPEGTQIYEMRKAYSQPGVYYTGFTLRKSTPWTPGDYRVDIYTNDSPAPAYSVTFSVVP
ncbi:MAG TPA: hypothetical protein VJ183_17980 [Chloroflexia bacterium]|nr:hypothetical protein [Chloroflexia bacterium]